MNVVQHIGTISNHYWFNNLLIQRFHCVSGQELLGKLLFLNLKGQVRYFTLKAWF